jgi:hypothetical protein
MANHETIGQKISKQIPYNLTPDIQQSVKDEWLQLTGFMENKTSVVL